MSYESLSDGGFISGTMLGSGGFIVLDETASIVKTSGTLRASTTMKVADNVLLVAKEQDGWKKFLIEF